MFVQPTSDLHWDTYPDGGKNFIDNLKPLKDGAILTIAGDIAEMRWPKYVDSIKTVCDKFEHVVMVKGNHEYWSTKHKQVDAIVGELSKISNCHVLTSGQPVEINGQRFLGDTGWFPRLPGQHVYAKSFPDFKKIEKFVPWVYDQHDMFRKYLLEELTSDDVLIMHHMPSYEYVAAQYEGDPWNRFFVGDISDIIAAKQPKLVHFGHTHLTIYPSRSKVIKSETLFYVNALGYPGEGVKFDHCMIVEI